LKARKEDYATLERSRIGVKPKELKIKRNGDKEHLLAGITWDHSEELRNQTEQG